MSSSLAGLVRELNGFMSVKCLALPLSTCSVAVDYFYDKSSAQPHEMGTLSIRIGK